ncbi:hypothetical protein SBI_08436 [Streptomyces bingchenggensis BCW-1]|uniref:Uncharacterized protein n=1 Tax=Streptomyces bingchenggensis (strain BCW-1) TaxID=749414 RepID=D7BSQ7_STRBB|nr:MULTISPECIES: hypothetical protein [Streptomyces]ADI11554.1 hypothetical protein SBI_08436 [Streptomyces bingchenggensis BCW-1]
MKIFCLEDGVERLAVLAIAVLAIAVAQQEAQRLRAYSQSCVERAVTPVILSNLRVLVDETSSRSC